MFANFVVKFLNTSLFTKLLVLWTSQILGIIVGPPTENCGGGGSDPRFYRQRTPWLSWLRFQSLVLWTYGASISCLYSDAAFIANRWDRNRQDRKAVASALTTLVRVSSVRSSAASSGLVTQSASAAPPVRTRTYINQDIFAVKYCTTRTLYSTTVNIEQYIGRGVELAHKCPDIRWWTGTCSLSTSDSFIDMHFYSRPPPHNLGSLPLVPIQILKLQEHRTPIRFVSLALLKREPKVVMWLCLSKSEWEEMRESSEKQR